MTESSIHISVVAPAYNEAENLPQLVEETRAACERIGRPWEMILANDASTDDTSAVLDRLMAETPQLRVVDMVRNSGQTAALEASLDAARGAFIATLDADCQNDPADIPALLEMVESDQCDYVNGWRADRKDQGWRLIVSKYGNAFRNWMTRESIHDSGCGLKVFRRECLDRVRLFNGGHRFFVTYVRMRGWRIAEAKVNHRPRQRGVAKYGFFDRVFKVIKDAFVMRWMMNKNVNWKATERPRG